MPLLPYIERTDIYTLWRNSANWATVGLVPGWSSTSDPPPVYIDVLNCPSSPPTAKEANTPCVYVGNGGMVDTESSNSRTAGSYPADFQANGVFFNHFNPAQLLVTGASVTLMGKTTTVAAQVPNPGPMVYTSQDYITVHDGSSLTLMLSENNYAPWPWLIQANGPDISSGQTYNGASFWGPSLSVAPPYAAGTEIQNCFVFWPDGQPTSYMKINSPAPTRAMAVGNQLFQTMAPSSNHPTGVNVSFCDGHTRFLSQDIDYSIYCLLMTPWGQMCNTPGMTSGAMDVGSSANAGFYYPSGTNNYLLLRSKPIDESAIN